MTEAPGAATRVAAVLGHPVRHSLSPVLHNAAFATAGLDWVYVAFEVPAEHGATAIRGAAALGLAGLSITMPLKEVAAASVDRLMPVAARLGAVNTVRLEGGELVGDNTDGAGLVDALQEAGWRPAGRTCAVLGAGGAARASVLALAEAGAARVVVVNRTPGRAEAAAALAGAAGAVGTLAQVADADLVVNATPVGMAGAGGAAVDAEAWAASVAARLGPGQTVVDLIYRPLRTPLLAAAEARGAATVNGLGMLVHQAGHQFRLWTGQPPPLEAMSAAVRQTLGPAGAKGAERRPDQ